MARRFLVTGGAGYIGSHLTLALLERGDEVTVLDNLSQGHLAAVPNGAKLVRMDLADFAGLDAVLADGKWDAVFHFAALSLVGESMREPFRYLAENGVNGIRLIESCVRHGVGRFVLSSTANLFGDAPRGLIPEDSPVDPGSPYGESKFMVERALHWAARIHGLRFGCLRYFNAAGADPQGRLGEDHDPETHLIPLVIDAALGRRQGLSVFGNDYNTPDGTCIRDYVHVTDLAVAHLLALDRLEQDCVTYNVGIGEGASVLEVIRAAERVTGREVPHTIAARRAGDPAMLVASSLALRRETGWAPRFTDLHEIVATAAAWREAHPHGYASRELAPS